KAVFAPGRTSRGRASARSSSSTRSRKKPPLGFEMSRRTTVLPSRLASRGARRRGTATESVGSRNSVMALLLWRDALDDEPAAAAEREAGDDRREPPGGAAGHQDDQVVRAPELRDARLVVRRIGELRPHALGQALAPLVVRNQLPHPELAALPEVLPHARLVPPVLGQRAGVLGRQDDQRVAVAGELVVPGRREAGGDRVEDLG